MNSAAKLGVFAAAVAVVFAGAYGVGQAVGPVATEPQAEQEMGEMDMKETEGGHDDAAEGGHAEGEAGELPAAGLMISDRGYTLKVLTEDIAAGAPQDFAFQILDHDGHPVTDFQVEHDKLMHLIVTRRDLSGFRHLHPTMDADGTWRIDHTFAEAGEYRVFADFLPAGTDDGLTLGADVPVAGDFTPRPLPAPATTATVDGYTVTLNGTLTPGTTSELTLSVSKDGRPVTDLQPYLGAFGHLIALRDGDLAYLHVHPEGEPGDGVTRPGPDITFFAEVPSAGDYRLFLDFQHQGVVRTAEFTAHAEEG